MNDNPTETISSINVVVNSSVADNKSFRIDDLTISDVNGNALLFDDFNAYTNPSYGLYTDYSILDVSNFNNGIYSTDGSAKINIDLTSVQSELFNIDIVNYPYVTISNATTGDGHVRLYGFDYNGKYVGIITLPVLSNVSDQTYRLSNYAMSNIRYVLNMEIDGAIDPTLTFLPWQNGNYSPNAASSIATSNVGALGYQTTYISESTHVSDSNNWLVNGQSASIINVDEINIPAGTNNVVYNPTVMKLPKDLSYTIEYSVKENSGYIPGINLFDGANNYNMQISSQDQTLTLNGQTVNFVNELPANTTTDVYINVNSYNDITINLINNYNSTGQHVLTFKVYINSVYAGLVSTTTLPVSDVQFSILANTTLSSALQYVYINTIDTVANAHGELEQHGYIQSEQ